jgi:hypothetical protein
MCLSYEAHSNTKFGEDCDNTYQIPSAIVLSVVLVFNVQFVSLIPKNYKRPWTY